MIKIECSKCKEIYTFEDSELDHEIVSTDPDRQMGPEHNHSGIIEFQCGKCGNAINAEFDFWEYPAMALNHSDVKTDGCTVIEEPDYQAYLAQS